MERETEMKRGKQIHSLLIHIKVEVTFLHKEKTQHLSDIYPFAVLF